MDNSTKLHTAGEVEPEAELRVNLPLQIVDRRELVKMLIMLVSSLISANPVHCTHPKLVVRGTSEDLIHKASRLDGKSYPAYHDLLGNTTKFLLLGFPVLTLSRYLAVSERHSPDSTYTSRSVCLAE